MERKKVEELVEFGVGIKMEKGRVCGGRPRAWWWCACCWSSQETKEMKKVKEREDGDACIYKGENNIIISHHHFPSKDCCVHNVPRLRLGKYRAKRGNSRLRPEENAKRLRFREKDKGMGDWT